MQAHEMCKNSALSYLLPTLRKSKFSSSAITSLLKMERLKHVCFMHGSDFHVFSMHVSGYFIHGIYFHA